VRGATRYRDADVVTFLVTASAVGFAAIGSAFWGLLAGLAVAAVQHLRPARPAGTPEGMPAG
jgi:benzoate membrane transport protein